MNIRETIDAAEHKQLGEAFDFCRKCFSTVYLPSHDETHHLRVWHFAKGLIPGYHKTIRPLSRDQVEGILLAVMLHDTGMSETIDFTHGHASRRLAAMFFSRTPSPPTLTHAILTAIEKHDDKNYASPHSPASDEGIILSLLSLADDMDAFGFIGVFRYYEIYVMRAIPSGQVAERVLPNLDHRFNTMEAQLAPWTDLLRKQKKRYLITHNFFVNLQEKDPGAKEVIEVFEQHIRIPRKNPEQIIPEMLKHKKTTYVSDFFTGMQKELSSFAKAARHITEQ
ncbi:MAG: hypothetical protein J7K46_11565 [Bacteroidales bacterium]|nr:hypothetical protein [Bacteroidales bacterium]